MNTDNVKFNIYDFIRNPPWNKGSIVPIQFYLIVYPEAKKKRFISACSGKVEHDELGRITDFRILRGPNGFALCRFCGKETHTMYNTFCGESCVKEFSVRTRPEEVRIRLFERDKGVCASCNFPANYWFTKIFKSNSYKEVSLTLDALETEISPIWKKKTKPLRNKNNWIRNYSDGTEKCTCVTSGMFWEAAHIVDIQDGGGVCGLEGYRTLCVPCHEKESRLMDERKSLNRYHPNHINYFQSKLDNIKLKALEKSNNTFSNSIYAKNFRNYVLSKPLEIPWWVNTSNQNYSEKYIKDTNVEFDVTESLGYYTDEDISSHKFLNPKDEHFSNYDYSINPEKNNASHIYLDKKKKDIDLLKYNNTAKNTSTSDVSLKTETNSTPPRNQNPAYQYETPKSKNPLLNNKSLSITSNQSKTSPSVRHKWTQEQKIKLINLVEYHGRRWSDISTTYFKGHSPKSLSSKFDKMSQSGEIESIRNMVLNNEFEEMDSPGVSCFKRLDFDNTLEYNKNIPFTFNQLPNIKKNIKSTEQLDDDHFHEVINGYLNFEPNPLSIRNSGSDTKYKLDKSTRIRDNLNLRQEGAENKQQIHTPKKRNFWTHPETEALIDGYKKYGNNWVSIKNAYPEILRNRSNVDLKDKFRVLKKNGTIS
ncbi:hypothetical protein BB559_004886 [Furculomyces boomerangus]|uniref:Myb-like domain-containing protein n=1 Tax=Furculomyces boomerangus TaxID=61424 RepID=A0A2T9YC34_9FUNG|nr:hypothetical protein BB559_004876 [Furculomyces boomerangus]PVU89900.1 hypothetical protein BB559_004886 [Furculomyces boomerangus]